MNKESKNLKEEILKILNDKNFNLSLLELSSRQYDIYCQNILKNILKIKEIIKEYDNLS